MPACPTAYRVLAGQASETIYKQQFKCRKHSRAHTPYTLHPVHRTLHTAHIEIIFSHFMLPKGLSTRADGSENPLTEWERRGAVGSDHRLQSRDRTTEICNDNQKSKQEEGTGLHEDLRIRIRIRAKCCGFSPGCGHSHYPACQSINAQRKVESTVVAPPHHCTATTCGFSFRWHHTSSTLIVMD